MKRSNPNKSNSPKKRRKVEGFKEILTHYGFQFGEIYAVEDPAVLQANLEKKLRNEDTKTLFVEGFETHVDDTENLRRCLRNTQKTSGEMNLNMSQSSLVKILLGVPSIQKDILESLFLQVIDCSEEDSDPVHRHIFRNMRWLEAVFDIEWLTEKITEVLNTLSPEKQKDLIGVLPEIISDDSQDDLTDLLIETLEENKELTVHILDCLSNMALSDDKLSTTQTNVLGMLKSVKVDEIPVLLKFLCRTCTKDNIKKIFMGIRSAIDPTSLDPEDSAIIVPAMRNSVRQKSLLGSSFNDLLSNLTEFTPFDLWLWFCLADLSTHKAKVIQKIVSKVKQGKIDFELFENAVAPHRNAMDGLFPAMEDICEAMVRNKEAQVFGKDFYVTLFKVFEDKHRRQDLVFKQIVHIGSQKSHEINMALDALYMFMVEDEKSMRCFVTVIKQLLDYVHFLDLAQLRKFYTIFVQLSIDIDVCTGDIEIDPNFEILIQKQFSHANPDIQKMGVIGKLRILSRLSKELQNESIHENLKEQAIVIVDELINKLTMMRSNMRAFTYDEINVVIQFDKLDIFLVERFTQLLQDSFEELFFGDFPMGDVKLPSVSRFDVKPELWFNIDGNDCRVCVKIANIVCNPEESQFMQLLLPLWDLMVTLHWRTKGSLTDLDAVLGCPLLMFDEKVISEGLLMTCDHKSRRLLMDCVVVAINWFREMLNAFLSRNDDTMVAEYDDFETKIVSRLHNMIQLQNRLEGMLLYHPKYLPSWLNATRNPFGKPKKIKPPKPKKEGKRKRKRKSDGSEKSPARPKAKAKRKSNDMKFDKLRVHFTEIRPAVFERILAYDLSTETADSDEIGAKLTLPILHDLIFEWKRLIDTFCVNATWFREASGTVSTLMSHYNETTLMKEMNRSFIHVRKHLFHLMRITANNADNEELVDYVTENNSMIVSTMLMIFSALDKLIKCKKLKGSDELTTAFAYLAYEDEDEAKSAVAPDSFETFFNDLKTFIEGQENVEIIVMIVRLLNKIPLYCKSRKRVLENQIQSICMKLLKKTFAEEVTWKSQNLGVFITSFVTNATQPVKKLSTLVENMVDLQTTEFGASMTERNIGIYFQCVMPMLTKQLYALKLQNQDIEPVLKIAQIFRKAVEVIGNQADNKAARFRLQSCFLKEGSRFLEFLSRRGFMELCGTNLKDEEVNDCLKCGTKVLKYIARISDEAKTSSDDKLSSYIPEAAKASNKFIFEVKNLFSSKGHHDAVKIGVLKNVRVNGEEYEDEENANEEDVEEMELEEVAEEQEEEEVEDPLEEEEEEENTENEDEYDPEE